MTQVKSLRLWPVSRRSAIVCGSAAVLAGVTVTLYALHSPAPSLDAPAYEVVLPGDRTIEDLGGWQVNPTENDPVFAYKDEIDDIEIKVSQQPIPESFAGNVAGNVREIAQKGSYSTTLEAGGTQVYIGRSARGPQSVVFAKNNVLVFIKSQRTISNSEWISYINRLVDPSTEGPTF